MICHVNNISVLLSIITYCSISTFKLQKQDVPQNGQSVCLGSNRNGSRKDYPKLLWKQSKDDLSQLSETYGLYSSLVSICLPQQYAKYLFRYSQRKVKVQSSQALDILFADRHSNGHVDWSRELSANCLKCSLFKVFRNHQIKRTP